MTTQTKQRRGVRARACRVHTCSTLHKSTHRNREKTAHNTPPKKRMRKQLGVEKIEIEIDFKNLKGKREERILKQESKGGNTQLE